MRRSPPPSRRPTASAKGFLGYALIGFLVGVVPIALGLLWLPSLRTRRPEWLAAFMALTAGLLSFLGVESLCEAFDRSRRCSRWARRRRARPARRRGELPRDDVPRGPSRSWTRRHGRRLGLALLVAIGIGVHNLGEGLAIGTSFAFGELQLGTFLIVGFMIHNVTEGLGIAAPVAEGGARRASFASRSSRLAVIAGRRRFSAPGSAATHRTTCSACSSSRSPPAPRCQVVVEVGRFVARRAPGGLHSGYVVGGYLAGIAVMYATGLLAG